MDRRVVDKGAATLALPRVQAGYDCLRHKGGQMNTQPSARISQASGTVKWFDARKGYGFVIGPQGQDIFVHFTKIDGTGFRALADGALVEYDAELTERGWHATRVVGAAAPEVTILPPSHHRSPRRT
jgi:CspA family cold shock protein